MLHLYAQELQADLEAVQLQLHVSLIRASTEQMENFTFTGWPGGWLGWRGWLPLLHRWTNDELVGEEKPVEKCHKVESQHFCCVLWLPGSDLQH